MQFNIKAKTNNPIKIQPKDLNRHFSKENIQIVKKSMKRCSMSPFTREIQIKTIIRYQLTPVRMAIIDNPQTRNAGESESHSVVSSSLELHGPQPARLLGPWNFSGKNTGMGCHGFLQGIFPTQGSDPGLLYCRQILYCLSYPARQMLERMQIKQGTFLHFW